MWLAAEVWGQRARILEGAKVVDTFASFKKREFATILTKPYVLVVTTT